MADREQLFAEYIERWLAGDRPDANTFLDQAEDEEREELGDMIDAFLIDAPRQPFDAQAYEGSAAQRAVEAIDRSVHGQSGLWPALLPRLRNRAKVKREDLVKRLAQALGVADDEEKVGAYYHQMEQGQLPARGVSTRVLDALGQIVGESAEAIRRAGEALPPGTGGLHADTVHMRTALPSEEWDAPAVLEKRVTSAADEGLDEVDRLFRGG